MHLPGGFGVRVDTAAYDGYVIPAFYDSMLAKLIVHGRTREEAIARMRSALGKSSSRESTLTLIICILF